MTSRTGPALTRRHLLAGLGAAITVGASGARAQMQGPSALLLRPVPRPVPDAAALVRAAGLAGQVGYAVVDVATGALREAASADLPLPPASTLKTITALYALDRLGAERRFRTRVLRAGDILVLAGGGDPVLSTDDLAQLADLVVAEGGPPPTRFLVWGGALPQMDRIAADQASHLAYNPALSGMILNFNRVHLGWQREGAGYALSLEARGGRLGPRAYTITASAEDQAPLFTYRQSPTQEIWQFSRAAMGRAGSRWLPVRRPELYAGDVFQTLCRARSLVLPTPEIAADLPPGAVEVAGHDSPPLAALLRDMLYFSTNLTAEVLGLQASGAPDLRSSAAAMQAWLLAQGQGQRFHLADHSGLSDDSRVRARGMAQMMAGAVDLLPPLLKADPLAQGGAVLARVRAKTGTLNFVSNLAGYVDAPDGRRLGFAILCADSPRLARTRGQELPAGLRPWIGTARQLQGQMIEGWARRYSMR